MQSTYCGWASTFRCGYKRFLAASCVVQSYGNGNTAERAYASNLYWAWCPHPQHCSQKEHAFTASRPHVGGSHMLAAQAQGSLQAGIRLLSAWCSGIRVSMTCMCRWHLLQLLYSGRMDATCAHRGTVHPVQRVPRPQMLVSADTSGPL